MTALTVVDVGKTVQIKATVLPENATDKTLTWSSSNPSIATVNQNGLVTGIKEGTVKISAVANDAGGMKSQGLRADGAGSDAGAENVTTVRGAEFWKGFPDFANSFSRIVFKASNSVITFIYNTFLDWEKIKQAVDLFVASLVKIEDDPWAILEAMITFIPVGWYALLGFVGLATLPVWGISWLIQWILGPEFGDEPLEMPEFEGINVENGAMIIYEDNVSAASLDSDVEAQAGIIHDDKIIRQVNLVLNGSETQKKVNLLAEFASINPKTVYINWAIGPEQNPIAAFSPKDQLKTTMSANRVGYERAMLNGISAGLEIDFATFGVAVVQKSNIKHVALKVDNTMLYQQPTTEEWMKAGERFVFECATDKRSISEGSMAVIGEYRNPQRNEDFYLVDTGKDPKTNRKWMFVLKGAVVPLLDRMLANIPKIPNREGDDLSADQIITLTEATKALYNASYEPAFIAGMLAHSVHEGSIGEFEGYWGGEKYTKILVDSHRYRERFTQYPTRQSHGRRIYSDATGVLKLPEDNLETVYKMAEKLEKDYAHLKYEDRPGFGLGMVQWTRSRTFKLLGYYKEEANGRSTVTRAEAIRAETRFMLWELKFSTDGKRIDRIYPDWEVDANDMKPSDAARLAGEMLADRYIISKYMRTERIKLAEEIYGILTET